MFFKGKSDIINAFLESCLNTDHKKNQKRFHGSKTYSRRGRSGFKFSAHCLGEKPHRFAWFD